MVLHEHTLLPFNNGGKLKVETYPKMTNNSGFSLQTKPGKIKQTYCNKCKIFANLRMFSSPIPGGFKGKKKTIFSSTLRAGALFADMSAKKFFFLRFLLVYGESLT